MIWVDWCLAGVLAASIVIGVFRGFIREVFGLASWILAFIAALFLADSAARALTAHIATPSLRVAAGYAIVFFGVLLIGSVVTHLVTLAVRKSPLSGFDRTVGGGFGLLRGVALALLFVWLAGKTPARQDPWWTQSLFIGHLDEATMRIGRWVPERWRHDLNPSPSATTSA